MKWTVFGLWLVTVGVGLGLRYLNLRHLREHGEEVPAGFEGALDGEALRRSAAYTVARSRFGLAHALWDDALLLVFYFGGLLPLCDRLLTGESGSFIGNGVVFFLVLLLAQSLLGLPFDLWRTFRLEARFGFNTTKLRLWVADRIKELLLSLLLLGGLIAAALWLVQASPVPLVVMGLGVAGRDRPLPAVDLPLRNRAAVLQVRTAQTGGTGGGSAPAVGKGGTEGQQGAAGRRFAA